jgi:hypothetical protein
MDFEELQDRFRALMPLMMIALALMGNALFAVRVLLPQWSAYDTLSAELEHAEAALVAQQSGAEDAGTIALLEHRLEGARDSLAENAGDLLTPEQADSMLDRLFTHAFEADVAVTNLQAQQATQSTQGDMYAVRVFRLEVRGNLRALLDFLVRFNEASVASVLIDNVGIVREAEGAVLSLEMHLYTSPFTPGDVLATVPTAVPRQPTPVPIREATDRVEVTTVSYAAAPLPLHLLYVDTFDSADMYVWEDVDPSWVLVDVGILDVAETAARLTFRHDTLRDAAVQLRCRLDGGGVRLRLRESQAGDYSGEVDPQSGEVRLYRGDVLVRSVALPEMPADHWYTIQLSVIDDIVRLVVDQVEYIAIRDLAPLPPGTTSFELVGEGRLQVDEFWLWTL